MMPIVCLTRDAFPVATTYLELDDSSPTEIQLPIITCSQVNGARIACFSQLSFLIGQSLREYDTQRLIHNTFSWASGGVASMTKIAILGFDKQTGSAITKVLHEFGYFSEMYHKKIQFSNYHTVICSNDIGIKDETLINNLHTFIENGGGLIVFHRTSDETPFPLPFNSFLIKYGLSYTYCFLQEKVEETQPISIPSQFSSVRDNNFILLTARFKAIVGQTSIDTGALDDIVTLLRYYVMVSDSSLNNQLEEIFNYSWDYLNKSNYRTEAGICPDIKHGIIAVLLQELMPKLPVTSFTAIPEHTIFPGPTGDVLLSNYKINITLEEEIWTSTGLWLPAGKIGVVNIIGEPIPGLSVQVGSHTTGLLSKQGPLKRWPIVVSSFQFTQETRLEVGTSFGGIVYLVYENLSGNEFEKKVVLNFEGFCRYPRHVEGNPSVWDETRDIDVPWGEFETSRCIFTAPSSVIRNITDFRKTEENFDKITSAIAYFMRSENDFPFRIVFDVELTEAAQGGGYPIIMDEKYAPLILDDWETPNIQHIWMTSLLAMMSLREGMLDDITEAALSFVCSMHSLRKVFPDLDPTNLEVKNLIIPKLSRELWAIHAQYGENIIPETLERLNSDETALPDVPDDQWILFVKTLCLTGKRDFTNILECARPIPLSISNSFQGLNLEEGLSHGTGMMIYI